MALQIMWLTIVIIVGFCVCWIRLTMMHYTLQDILKAIKEPSHETK